MDGRRSWSGTLGRHASHETFEVRIKHSPVTGIAAPCPFQSLDAIRSPGREPAAQGAFCDPTFGSNAGQRKILLQVGLKEMETRDGL